MTGRTGEIRPWMLRAGEAAAIAGLWTLLYAGLWPVNPTVHASWAVVFAIVPAVYLHWAVGRVIATPLASLAQLAATTASLAAGFVLLLPLTAISALTSAVPAVQGDGVILLGPSVVLAACSLLAVKAQREHRWQAPLLTLPAPVCALWALAQRPDGNLAPALWAVTGLLVAASALSTACVVYVEKGSTLDNRL